MSASARIKQSTRQMAVIATGNIAASKEVSMRERFTFAQDIIVVLGLQLVFRTMMVLRKLNY